MKKILIAFENRSSAVNLKKKLSSIGDLDICCDGNAVLEKCRQCCPDLLILDLEMPHLDGATVLPLLRCYSQKMEIILITCCAQHNYVLQTASRTGVAAVLPKPYSTNSLVVVAYDVLSCHEQDHSDYIAEIDRVLLKLGFPRKRVGYSYLVAAIKMIQDNPAIQTTKHIYPSIAKQFGVTDCSVEGAVRNLIQTAWEQRQKDVWAVFFANAFDENASHPTNGYFIAQIAALFLQKKIS